MGEYLTVCGAALAHLTVREKGRKGKGLQRGTFAALYLLTLKYSDLSP